MFLVLKPINDFFVRFILGDGIREHCPYLTLEDIVFMLKFQLYESLLEFT
jgi:hypothetical protein